MGRVSADVARLGKELSNWGRWGVDDQRGTTNLITEQVIADAAALVRRGRVFDLGIPLDANGPQTGRGRSNPVRLMAETGHDQDLPGGFHFTDDYVFMPLQAGTQWDALAHVYYGGAMWNGMPVEHITASGAARNAIEMQGRGIVGRGVLLDVAHYFGVDSLGPTEAITSADLDATAAAQGVTIRGGDILLVRTGWYSAYLREGDRRAFMATEPGLDLTCARWLRELDVAAVAADNWGVEVWAGAGRSVALELHMVLIRDIGMTLGELFDLERLAMDCAEDGVWEFFLTAPPLKFTGAVGSPINPLAIK